MISIDRITRTFGSRVLFKDASLRIGARDRVAVVGPNGSGKTTLFEMIMGRQEPDDGSISINKNAVLGYLAQETDPLRGRSIIDEVLKAGGALAETGHRLEVLTDELETAEPEERDRLLAEYSRLQEHFQMLGGYSLEAQARQILAGLGFSDADLERPTDTLSGGWLMRVALAKLLLEAPDVLLLDEPTNHLDVESIAWLEKFLKTYEGVVLLISHDRDFIEAMANVIVEIEDGGLVRYAGDYETFVRVRTQRLEAAIAAAKAQSKRVDQIERFIARFRYNNKKATMVQSRVKMLDKMDRVVVPKDKQRVMKFGFPTPPRSGRMVLEMKDVRFGYDPAVPVYAGLNVAVERGQKVALVGPNGAGKSTLLKLLAGALTPQGGERVLGHNVSVGYFAQHQIEALIPTNRVMQELQRAIPPGVDVKPRNLLGRFLFSGDDVEKPVSVLSGGERTRLALARLLCEPHNALCMDEPTNHLDMQSRDMLEEALVDYEGSLVLITHDRHLIRSVADHIIEVDSGRVRHFVGDYESYLARKEAEEQPVVVKQPAGPRTADSRAEARKERARERAEAAALKKVERELDHLATARTALETKMGEPDFYTSGEDVAAAVKEFESLQARIAALESEWERLTDETA